MGITYTGTGGGVPRKTAKIFAKNAASGDMTVFGSTLAGNTVYTQDLDSIQSSHYEVGWREGVISDLNYPLMSDMNAVQKTLSQQIAYGLQHGIPEWDAGTTYYAYDIVQSGGILYTSIIDHNINNSVTDTTKWAVYYDPSSFDNYANKSLSNLNSTGEKHFVNKSQVTNCILEAPNGVFAAIAPNTTSTLTVKNGLKILVPNGRNADGTMNNAEFTLNTDSTYTYAFGAPLINEYIFLRNDNVIERCNGNYVFFVQNYAQLTTQTGTNTYKFGYVENDNLWYKTTDGTNWASIGMCPIGKLSVYATNYIYDVRPDYELSLANTSTFSKSLLTTTASFPSNWLYVDLAWSNASPFYIVAPANGYIAVWRTAEYETDWICLAQNMDTGTGGVTTVSSTGGYVEGVGFNYLHAYIPVQKGTTVGITHRGTGVVNQFRFIYAKGDE